MLTPTDFFKRFLKNPLTLPLRNALSSKLEDESVTKKVDNMSRWYVKDLSKLAKVSVRALRHYDQIGLLKPSLRATNGYRLYSESDLSKLQQIVALKSFGFDLTQIKTLLAKTDVSVHKHLSAQAQFLKAKAAALAKASKTLEDIISDCSHDESGSCSWKNIIKLFGVYNMIHELEQTDISKLLTSEQIKTVMVYNQNIKEGYLDTMCEEAQKLISEDPSGPIAQNFVANWMPVIDKYKEGRSEVEYIYAKIFANAEKGTPPDSILKSLAQMSGLSPEKIKAAEWIGVAFAHAQVKKYKEPLASDSEELKKITEQLKGISEETMKEYFADWQTIYREIELLVDQDPHGEAAQAAINKWWVMSAKYKDVCAILYMACKNGIFTPPSNIVWPMPTEVAAWTAKAVQFMMTGKAV